MPTEIGSVVAFYRREFANRKFHEETAAGAVKPDSVMLTFTSPEATAVLKLGRAYDLTTVNLVQKVLAGGIGGSRKGKKRRRRSIHAGCRERGAGGHRGIRREASCRRGFEGPAQALGLLAGNTVPVPLPATAADVEYRRRGR